MADLSSTRAVRLNDIASYLATRNRLTTGPQIAEAFGISLRTVYRDIDDIRVMGLDVSGESGSGYLLGRDQFIEWFLSKVLRNSRARDRRSMPNISEQRIAAALAMQEAIT